MSSMILNRLFAPTAPESCSWRTRESGRVGLNLSPQAERLLAHAPGPAEGVLPKALLILSEDSLQALDASLSKVIQQLDISDHGHADKPLADL